MIPQNIYLASRYSRKKEMNTYATELRSFGSRITASWLEEVYEPDVQMREITDEENRNIAVVDLQDIVRADVMIFFAEDQNNQPPRGGRHVEFGIALAHGLKIYVIGERENIFHHLPQVVVYPTWQDFIDGVYL